MTLRLRLAPGAIVVAAVLLAAAIGLPAPITAQEADPPEPQLNALQLGAASALDGINAYRGQAGVPPAVAHPALMRSAASHVAYYELNLADASLAGMGLHEERADAQGFTGVSIGERARAAGYASAAVTENAGFGGLHAAIDWYMNTVNHRLPIIHPSALDMGMAASDGSGFNIIQVGLRREAPNVALPSVYPTEGATNVPVSWDGAEAPNPAPGLPRPLGYPLTMAFGVGQRVEWGKVELRTSTGDAVELSAIRTDWMRALAVIPHRPLEAGQSYTAVVEAVVDGKPVSKTWSFVTAAQ